MLPVAISMLGTGARRPTVAFLGWFGPRGAASIVFALLVLEEDGLPHEQLILATAFVTVGLSVVAHGVTAAALTTRYADWLGDPCGRGRPVESGGEAEVRVAARRASEDRLDRGRRGGSRCARSSSTAPRRASSTRCGSSASSRSTRSRPSRRRSSSSSGAGSGRSTSPSSTACSGTSGSSSSGTRSSGRPRSCRCSARACVGGAPAQPRRSGWATSSCASTRA